MSYNSHIMNETLRENLTSAELTIFSAGEPFLTGNIDEDSDWLKRSNAYHKIKRKIFVLKNKQKSLAWKYWIESDNTEEFDAIKDEGIEVIEKYYAPQKSKNSDIITMFGREYNTRDDLDNQIKEGIWIVYEPYANNISIHIRGFIGDCNQIAGSGDLELSGKQFLRTVRYNVKELPSKADLIDDFLMLEVLQTLPPVGFIVRDTKKYPVFPTARDYFS